MNPDVRVSIFQTKTVNMAGISSLLCSYLAEIQLRQYVKTRHFSVFLGKRGGHVMQLRPLECR